MQLMMDILRPICLMEQEVLPISNINMTGKKLDFQLMDLDHLWDLKCMVSMELKISLNSKIGDLQITNGRKVSKVEKLQLLLLPVYNPKRRLPEYDWLWMNLIDYLEWCIPIGTLKRHSWPSELTLGTCFYSLYLSHSYTQLGERKWDYCNCWTIY